VASRAVATGQQEPTFPLPPLGYREATRLSKKKKEEEEKKNVIWQKYDIMRTCVLVHTRLSPLMTTFLIMSCFAFSSDMQRRFSILYNDVRELLLKDGTISCHLFKY
jgi:hypothetical protein